MTETTLSTMDARVEQPPGSAQALPLALQSMFWQPEYLEPSAWMEHLPFAFWLMDAQRPRTFVELGSHHGTSYFAFCQAAGRLGLDARCFAVDTWKGDEHAGFYDERIFNKVRAYNDAHYSGFSSLVRSTFDEAAAHFSDGAVDLLHIDGLHTFDAVSHDFEWWLPKLSQRAVVVLHDINVRERGFGVFELFEKLKETYPCFEFVHGHGLGVVGVGRHQTPLLAHLYEANKADDAAAAIRSAFSRLGRACADAFAAKQLRDRALDSDEQLLRRKNDIAVLSERVTRAEASLEARFKETGSLTRMLLDVERANAERQREAADLARTLRDQERKIAAREREVADLHVALKQARAEHANALEQVRTAMAHAERKLRAEILDREWAAAQAKAARTTLEQELALLRAAHAQVLCSSSWKLTAPLRRGRSAAMPPMAAAPALSAERELLRTSELFDGQWYVRRYPDVAAHGVDAVAHYLDHGAAEGRDPGPRFSTSAYLRNYPGVRESGVNPLVHYLTHGFKEGRTATPVEPDRG